MTETEASENNAVTSYWGLAADGADGLWLAVEFAFPQQQGAAAAKDGGKYLLYRLNSRGGQEQVISLDAVAQQAEGAPLSRGRLTTDGAGRIYVAFNSGTIAVLEKTGDLAFTLQAAAQSQLRQIVRLSDGRVAAWLTELESDVLLIADAEARGWGERLVLPTRPEMFAEAAHYDFLYHSGDALYAGDMEAGTCAKVLTWLDLGLQGNRISFCRETTDASLLCLTQGAAPNDNRLLRLTKSVAATERTTLTLATLLSVSDIDRAIAVFNQSQEDYHIQQVEYLWLAEGQLDAAIQKLNTEIIAGKGPDLFVTYGLPASKYAAAGVLEDLYPWLDGDGELSRDSLLPQLLRAWETEGQLYSVAPDFRIYTGLGRTDLVGQAMHWTRQDLLTAWQQHPQMTQPVAMLNGCNAMAMLDVLCSFEIEHFADWPTGTCSFDSPEFIELLEFAAMFPVSVAQWGDPGYRDPEQMLAQGESLLQWDWISDYGDLQWRERFCGGPITFTGLPTADGNGYAFDSAQNMVAMSSRSQYKEGCWQFLRLLLSESFQTSDDVPSVFVSNRSAFDKKQALAMEMGVDEQGQPEPKDRYSRSDSDNVMFYVKTATEEEVAQTMALLNATQRTLNSDPFLMNIVQEEAAAFFAGQNSAEKTASLIQSRASIYMSEQR